MLRDKQKKEVLKSARFQCKSRSNEPFQDQSWRATADILELQEEEES
jgi:hypothetical protein